MNTKNNPRSGGAFSSRGDGGLVWAVGARGRDTVTMVVSHTPVSPDQFTRSCTPYACQRTGRRLIPATVSRSKQLLDAKRI